MKYRQKHHRLPLCNYPSPILLRVFIFSQHLKVDKYQGVSKDITSRKPL